MIPCAIKVMEAPFIKRDHDTDEVSWPPPKIELELIELGLIPRRADDTRGTGTTPRKAGAARAQRRDLSEAEPD